MQRFRFTEAADLIGATPGIVMQVTPLLHDKFEVDMTIIRLGDMVLVRGACSPLVLVAQPGPATVAVQFPMDGLDTLILNGRPLPPFGFCLVGQGVELVRSNTKANTYALLIMPPAVADAHLIEEDGHSAFKTGEHLVRVARPEEWNRMAQLVRSAATIAQEAPDVFASEPPRLALRASLLGVTGRMLANAGGVERTARRGSSDASARTVLGAEAYLKTHVERPIYTEELCKVLGVSPATLGDAFQRTMGMSPHRYLKLRRLNMVRTALLEHREGTVLVKSVALDHGFWHLGEFAREYRERFGETPSQTLAAAKSCAPPETAADDHGTGGTETPEQIRQHAGRTR